MIFELQPYSIKELGKRKNQEDSMFPDYGKSTPEDRLFILCDGMGGHERGEVASATVCETISNTILSQWNPDEPLSDELLQQAIADAYDALDSKDNNEAKKMGTTLTLLCFHSEGATVAHIGDSRVYQLRPKHGEDPARIMFKTRDHSLVNDLVAIGEITEEEAKDHPQKNVITRAMQPCQERRCKADIAHITDIKPGDYFYMCSDGMLEQTTDKELLFMISKFDASDEEKVKMLREVTSENHDNHTAHLIHITKVEANPARVQSPDSIKRFNPIFAIIAFFVLAAAVAAYFLFFSSPSGNNNEVQVPDTVQSVIEKEKPTPVVQQQSSQSRVKEETDSAKKDVDVNANDASTKPEDVTSSEATEPTKTEDAVTVEESSDDSKPKVDLSRVNKFLPKKPATETTENAKQ